MHVGFSSVIELSSYRVINSLRRHRVLGYTALATRETIAYSIQFKEFDGKVEQWKQYVGRLRYVLDANNITDVEKKSAHLLSCNCLTTY